MIYPSLTPLRRLIRARVRYMLALRKAKQIFGQELMTAMKQRAAVDARLHPIKPARFVDRNDNDDKPN